jgi:hypothetical protein
MDCMRDARSIRLFYLEKQPELGRNALIDWDLQAQVGLSAYLQAKSGFCSRLRSGCCARAACCPKRISTNQTRSEERPLNF